MAEIKKFWNYPPTEDHETEWTVWWDLPEDGKKEWSHTWAFIYYCKSRGDVVYVKGTRGETINMAIKRKRG